MDEGNSSPHWTDLTDNEDQAVADSEAVVAREPDSESQIDSLTRREQNQVDLLLHL